MEEEDEEENIFMDVEEEVVEGDIIIDLEEEEEEQVKALAFKEAFEEEREGLEWLSTQEEIRRLAEKSEIDEADAEEDNLSDIGDSEEMTKEVKMDREQNMEEMNFELDHQTQLLDDVKEGDCLRTLVSELLLKCGRAGREKETMLKEKGRLLVKAEKEKQDLIRERNEAESKYKKLVEQIEERLECPMCLTVPKEAPAITCKKGHLACLSCLHGWLAGGRRQCPYCRGELLFGVKSLLADLVIKNIDHECNLNGCVKRVPYDDLADHQEKCQFRLVKCPGSNQQCNMMVPFCQVVPDHFNECSDMTMCQYPDESLSLTFSEDCLEESFGWDTIVIQHMLGTFFVRAEKDNSLFTIEVVMKGTEEDCQEVNAEITIKDPNSGGKSIFSCSHHPRPMGKENTKEFCLSVTQTALAKTWSHNKVLNRIVFFVDIKITVA